MQGRGETYILWVLKLQQCQNLAYNFGYSLHAHDNWISQEAEFLEKGGLDAVRDCGKIKSMGGQGVAMSKTDKVWVGSL